MVFAVSMVCFVYALLQAFQMFGELKAFRQKSDPNPIFLFIPILNLITLWKLSEQVLEAKRLAGIPNPTTVHPVLYLFLSSYFLPLELNEIWKAAGGGPRLSSGG